MDCLGNITLRAVAHCITTDLAIARVTEATPRYQKMWKCIKILSKECACAAFDKGRFLVYFSENMLPALLSKLRTFVFLLLLFLASVQSIRLSEECKTVIRRALEAWMKEFPYRILGHFYSSLHCDPHFIPDIVIWDPLTKF